LWANFFQFIHPKLQNRDFTNSCFYLTTISLGKFKTNLIAGFKNNIEIGKWFKTTK
jgi:hypothetical protein